MIHLIAYIIHSFLLFTIKGLEISPLKTNSHLKESFIENGTLISNRMYYYQYESKSLYTKVFLHNIQGQATLFGYYSYNNSHVILLR